MSSIQSRSWSSKIMSEKCSSNGSLFTALLTRFCYPVFTNWVFIFPHTWQNPSALIYYFFCIVTVWTLSVSVCFLHLTQYIFISIKYLILNKMEIRDLSWNENVSRRFNNPLFPKSIRGLIVGKSGCGKTTLLLNLLLRPGWLHYDNLNIYVILKSLFQPEYRILKKAFEEQIPTESILGLFDNQIDIM